MEAGQYVQALQSRQGILVGSPEVAAYKSGAINRAQFQELAKGLSKSAYGDAIKSFETR